MFKRNKKGLDPETMRRVLDKTRRGELPTLREIRGLSEEQRAQVEQLNAQLGRQPPRP